MSIIYKSKTDIISNGSSTKQKLFVDTKLVHTNI